MQEVIVSFGLLLTYLLGCNTCFGGVFEFSVTARLSSLGSAIAFVPKGRMTGLLS